MPPPSDHPLRAACIHGRYESHRFEVIDGDWMTFETCSDFRDITIDWETVGRIMWDTMFHDIDHWDGLPEKHKQLWLHELPIGFAAAIGDTNE